MGTYGGRQSVLAMCFIILLAACEVPQGMDRPSTAAPESGARATAAGSTAGNQVVPSTGSTAETLTPLPRQALATQAGPTAAGPTAADSALPGAGRASFEGISFQYDPAIVPFVTSESVAADPVNDRPGEPIPRHVLFTLEGYPSQNVTRKATIAVYSVDAYEAVSPEAMKRIAALKKLLANGTVGAAGMEDKPDASDPLPYLPYVPTAELIHAQTRFVDFQGGRGLRYLTQHSLVADPITNAEIFYTFQGITTDGAFYVSANLPVSTTILPADELAGDADGAAEDRDAYLLDIVAKLDALSAADFTPRLDGLDAMVGSIAVAP